MRKLTIYLFIGVAFWGCKTKQEAVINPTLSTSIKPVSIQTKIAEELKNRINHLSDSDLVLYYKQNNYQPVFYRDSLNFKGIQWIKDSKYHGLNPEQFTIRKLDSIIKLIATDTINKPAQLAELDISLCQAISNCGQRIGNSPLNPSNYHDGWNYPNQNRKIPDSLWIAEIHKNGIMALDSLFEPDHKLYKILKHELKRLYSQKDNYTKKIQNPGFKLQLGDSNKFVLPIKYQLLNIPSDSILSMSFDKELQSAVIDFQLKHNLIADGIIGNETYVLLIWNIEDYINSIKVNIERLRWLPDHTLQDGFVVNLGNQKLHLYQNNNLIFDTKVIIGKYENQSPVFSSNLDYIVFNPCWTVPKSIATTTILNGMKRDSAFLEKRDMFICINGKEIDGNTIDINEYSPNNFPFTIFQRTNPQNALGQVKFMFENNFSIYLHDTPQKNLFNKNTRTFSHGCIRVKNAMDLAELLLQQDKHTTKKDTYLAKGYPVKVYLKNKIPIHIVYLTCHWNPEYNTIVYDKDVYLEDYKLLKDLKQKE